MLPCQLWCWSTSFCSSYRCLLSIPQATLFISVWFVFFEVQSYNVTVRSFDNGTVLCPYNEPIVSISRSGPSFADLVFSWKLVYSLLACRERNRSWIFSCGLLSKSNSGQWIAKHNKFHGDLNLQCPLNSFVSGLHTVYSHQWSDRIWWLHCSTLQPMLYLSEHECSTVSSSAYNLLVELSIRRVITGMQSVYNYNRRWCWAVI